MKIICLKAVLFFFITIGVLNAQQFPSLEAGSKAYEYARRLSGNDAGWYDLAEAALWASSANAGKGEEEKAEAYMRRISAAVAELSASDLPGDASSQGEFVLNFLHDNFLKSYSAKQTRVDEMINTGWYNCVSSSVLYMVLGHSIGLDIEGVMTKDHAFVMLNTGVERIDIETTNRYGFDPGNRKEFLDAFGRTTGFAYVPARNYRDRAAINRMELISLILSNRISALEQEDRFAEAIPLAINRTAFLSGNQGNAAVNDFLEDPYKDMMNRLFNLGASLVKNGKEDDTIAWAVYAGERYPDPRRWQDMIKTAAHNKVVKLLRTRKTDEARSFLTTMRPKLNGESYLEIEMMVLEVEAVSMVNAIRNSGDAEAALSFLASIGERFEPKRREEMQTSAILSEAERLGKAKDWAGSMRWLSSAMTQYGANSKLETAYKAYRQNRISELHNEFANLFNKKNYTQAKASVEKSLEEFPGEQQLLKNLAAVENALK